MLYQKAQVKRFEEKIGDTRVLPSANEKRCEKIKKNKISGNQRKNADLER